MSDEKRETPLAAYEKQQQFLLLVQTGLLSYAAWEKPMAVTLDGVYSNVSKMYSATVAARYLPEQQSVCGAAMDFLDYVLRAKRFTWITEAMKR